MSDRTLTVEIGRDSVAPRQVAEDLELYPSAAFEPGAVDPEPDALIRALTPPRGRLIVVSGPSGVGKDAVLHTLLGEGLRPERLLRCVTATTRAPRAGEVPGRDYFFFSHDEFEQRVRSGFFLEHAVYNGQYYGTPHDYPDAERERGNDVLLKIEVQGALQVKRRVPDALLVFIAPPSWEALERRLRGRNTDEEAKVLNRLRIAREEMRTAVHYDYLIVNDQVETAARAVQSVILAERHRIVNREA